MPDNLLHDALPPATGERFDALLRCGNVLIERIVSSAQPDGQLYKQTQDEWVLLVQGAATLQVGERTVALAAGDHLFIAAHTPHRVLHTDAGTVWLAVHVHPGAMPQACEPMATP